MNTGILDVAAVQRRLRAFSDARGWEPYQTPKNLAMAMVVEAGELVEIFQWMTPEASARIAEKPEVQQHLGEEMADVMVYLLQIADRCGIDIAAAIDRKMALNAAKYPAPADATQATLVLGANGKLVVDDGAQVAGSDVA
ncbi:nucleotide pyrophosphohydrolase [Sphaerotilus mobilis]|uniref:NTP pyrophosphatase (Non-canonical NTP hydrolase) n=1 Tax=Sphaerotilus mobilis TaxID=47994 RepID=A0A4Q7LMC2_9BURK|nr:nucleotide pyrophosphohydrolase [Sphaerotilus mobilis]RZS54848.1 NTP pyrophosphatase (non-canonical NTP hydrolase) [Sphaerotilus mobilis]